MKKSSSNNNLVPSDFYCCICGTKNIPVWRQKGKEREAGHLKRLYCHKCRKEQNCVEIKQNNNNYTYEDFCIEFEYGNFDGEGQRKISYGELRSKIHDGKIEKTQTLSDGRSSWVWEEYVD